RITARATASSTCSTSSRRRPSVCSSTCAARRRRHPLRRLRRPRTRPRNRRPERAAAKPRGLAHGLVWRPRLFVLRRVALRSCRPGLPAIARLVGWTGARIGAREILPLDRLGLVAWLRRPFDLARRGFVKIAWLGRRFVKLPGLGRLLAKLVR